MVYPPTIPPSVCYRTHKSYPLPHCTKKSITRSLPAKNFVFSQWRRLREKRTGHGSQKKHVSTEIMVIPPKKTKNEAQVFFKVK